MERSFGKEQLEKLFEETAEEQYTKTLLFSNVVGLMSLVVCGMYPSIGAAYSLPSQRIGRGTKEKMCFKVFDICSKFIKI